MNMKVYVVKRCTDCPNFKFTDVGVQRWECHALIEEQTIKLLSRDEMDIQREAIKHGFDVVLPDWCPLDDVH